MQVQPTIESVKKLIESNKGASPAPNMWPDANIDSKTNKYDARIAEGIDFDMMRYVKQVAAFQRFPETSSTLLAMGVVAAYASRKVWTQPFINEGTRPLNMYVAVGAGSGTGKTPTLNNFNKPAIDIYEAEEERKRRKRLAIEMEISDCREEMRLIKKANKDTSPSDLPAYQNEVAKIQQLNEELKKYSRVKWNFKQRNLQTIAIHASKQGGYVPIIADETQTINFITGQAAGVETSLFFDGFDGQDFGYGRQKKNADDEDDDIEIKNAVCSLCIAGQENIIDKLWSSSKSSSGESSGFMERFFCAIEKGVVGMKGAIPRGAVPQEHLKNGWRTMLENIITMGDKRITFLFESKSIEYMDDVHVKYDAACIDGGMFVQEPMRGFVQKSSSHIANIAGVLHIMKEWADDLRGKEKPVLVSHETVQEAARMFARIAKMHLVTLTAKGYIGADVRTNEVRESISVLVGRKRKKIFTNTEIQQAAGGKAIFRSGVKLTAKELMDNIYPMLENEGILCVVGKKVYVNPNFA